MNRILLFELQNLNLSKFTKLISFFFPNSVPYWSLGFHLCRYGYNSIEKAKQVTERTIHAGIPYDVMWLGL